MGCLKGEWWNAARRGCRCRAIGLKRDPGFEIEGVVVTGAPACTVDVGFGAVKVVVDGVLERDFDVAPRPERRPARLVEGEIIRLQDEAIALGRSGLAAGVEQLVLAATDEEILQRRAVGLVVEIVEGDLQIPQVVRRITGGVEGLAGVPVLALVDIRGHHREVVLIGGLLVLRIEPDVYKPVLAFALVAARERSRGESERAHLERAGAEWPHDGDPPVRGQAADLRFTGGIDADGFLEAPAQGAVSTDRKSTRLNSSH